MEKGFLRSGDWDLWDLRNKLPPRKRPRYRITLRLKRVRRSTRAWPEPCTRSTSCLCASRKIVPQTEQESNARCLSFKKLIIRNCWIKLSVKHSEDGCGRAGVSNLSLTMYSFRISTDEHVPLKFLYGPDQIFPKDFIMINHTYM